MFLDSDIVTVDVLVCKPLVLRHEDYVARRLDEELLGVSLINFDGMVAELSIWPRRALVCDDSPHIHYDAIEDHEVVLGADLELVNMFWGIRPIELRHLERAPLKATHMATVRGPFLGRLIEYVDRMVRPELQHGDILARHLRLVEQGF